MSENKKNFKSNCAEVSRTRKELNDASMYEYKKNTD